MEKPAMYLGQGYAAAGRAVDSQQKFIPSSRRRASGAKAGRDQAIGIAQAGDRDGKPDCVSWPAADHAGAVEGIGADAVKGSGAAKQVHRQEIGAARLR